MPRQSKNKFEIINDVKKQLCCEFGYFVSEDSLYEFYDLSEEFFKSCFKCVCHCKYPPFKICLRISSLTYAHYIIVSNICQYKIQKIFIISTYIFYLFHTKK